MTSDKVLSIFKDITRVPRESGHEEKIVAWLQDFAARHSLECRTDAAGNVVMVKPASPGKENVPVIVLQSHSDMVCEKNSGVEHDFAEDPIKWEIENGWMIARDTTLGADCGIGMAAQLAVLTSDLPTGRIEALFTVSEETGLDGAKALKPGFISGKVLINLDSEDEGELFIGCAGGLDTTARFSYRMESLSESGLKFFRVSVGNALGGHSGDDIDKGRANAVQLLARFLYSQIGLGLSLCSIDGGNKRNAIAREAMAVVAVPESSASGFKASFADFASDVRKEYAVTDPDVDFACESVSACLYAVEDAVAKALIASLFAAPHGVLAMSPDIKGLVETSTNLASVKMEGEGVIRIGTSQRSSVISAMRAAAAKVEACFRLAGAEVAHESEYPGWKPDTRSAILQECVASYRRLFGKEPVVRAIHAGLECGLFLETYPDLDMISFGPTLRGVHAPGERLDLASLDRFVRLLEDVLVNYK